MQCPHCAAIPSVSMRVMGIPQSLPSVQGSDAVRSVLNFCKNGIRFIVSDLEILSTEGKVVEFTDRVVDFEAHVPAVLCGLWLRLRRRQW